MPRYCAAMNVATDDAHGAGLVERVIAAIHAEPARLIVDDEPWLTAPPRPMPAEALAAAALPSGRALPPSVRRWLAFDSSLLARWSWLTSGGRFTPRRLPVFALDVDDLFAVDFAEGVERRAGPQRDVRHRHRRQQHAEGDDRRQGDQQRGYPPVHASNSRRPAQAGSLIA